MRWHMCKVPSSDVPISQCTETLYKEELGFFDGNIYLRGMSPCTELARNPATESTNKSVDNLSNSVVSSNALLPYEPDSESSDIIIEAVLKQERLSPGPSSLVPNKFNDSPRTSTSNVSFSKETKAGPAPVISSIRGNTCTQKQSLLPTSSSSQHYELNDSSHTSSAAWSSKKKRGPSNSEYPMQEKKKTIGRCCYCLETVGMRNLRTHMMEMHGNNEHVLRCRVQTCGIVLSLDPDVECRHYKAKHPDEIEYRSKQTDEYRSHSSKDENKLIVTRQETCKNIDRLKEIWQTIRKERK